MTSKNNRAPVLYHTKLGASFLTCGWSQTGVTVPKRLTRVKISNFLSCETLKCDTWTWKTIHNIFYTMSSSVHHFKAIGEFKLELQSGNSQFGLNSVILLSRVNLKFDGWHWRNNRAPFLYDIKRCASFQGHGWIPSRVTVRKSSIRVKIDDFMSRVTFIFDRWLWKPIGSVVHHFIAISEFTLELQSGNTQFGSKSLFLAATKQLYEWFSPSVRPSVCPSVTPFWLYSHHRIIMKFSGVITSDKSDVHAKEQGQRSKVKITEVTTQLNRFRTVTPVWIHIWWWNDAYSLKMLRRGALLFSKVIRQIARSHSSKNNRIWPRLGVSGL